MGTNLAPFEIDVEKLVYGGEGLARRDGQVILTPYVLPGERVEVAAAEEKAGLLRARLLLDCVHLLNVIRETPAFGRCGCAWKRNAHQCRQ